MALTAPRPRHFWPVAIAALLWTGFGACDFLMANLRDAAYFAQVPPEAVQHLDEMSYWAIGVWALAVWAAVLGALLLLLRSRFAVHAFAASLLGLAGSTVQRAGAGPMIAVIGIAAVLLLWYALRMRKLGVLR